jgi:hypothetical protein
MAQRLIGGFAHHATQVSPAICGPLCIAYLLQQILKSRLKRPRSPVASYNIIRPKHDAKSSTIAGMHQEDAPPAML